MADIYNADKILEVACGSGFHTETLACSFMKKNSMLVSCDIS